MAVKLTEEERAALMSIALKKPMTPPAPTSVYYPDNEILRADIEEHGLAGGVQEFEKRESTLLEE